MKNILLSFGFILLWSVAVAQSSPGYQVLRVTGKVYCERLHKNLETGDKISDKDILKFENSSAHLTVMGPQGRKLVRSTPQNSSSELKSLLTDIISLEKKHTASRGLDEHSKQGKAIQKIKTDLSSDTILILGSGKASFASSDVLMNDTAIMECRYRERHESVERRISMGTTVDISAGSLFTPNQPPVKIQLVYYPSKGNIFDYPPETLGSFVPMYAEKEKINREAAVIIAAISAKGKNQTLIELKKYFQDEYWPVWEENLVAWLTETNLMKP